MQDTPDLPRPRRSLDPYTQERIRADLLRPVAYRQGLVLVKSRLRKHRDLGRGVYHLVALADRPLANASPTFTLEEVEALLQRGQEAIAEQERTESAWRTQKTCTKCGQTKSLDEFYRHKGSLDGHMGICKACSATKSAAYHVEHRDAINTRARRNERRKRTEDPDYSYRNHLWGKFGMSLEEYEARLTAQGGACAVCGTAPTTMRLAVDHDRNCCPGDNSCGKCIRDLLCTGCNTGSGISDHPFLLRRKADYIDLWRFRHAEMAAPVPCPPSTSGT